MNFSMRFASNRYSRRCLFFFAMVFCSFMTGCLPGMDDLPIFGELDALPSGPVCKVAVVPFINDSEYPLADAIVKKVFTAQLQGATNYLIIPEGDVLKVFQQEHILPGQLPSAEQLAIIADRVSAQLLVSGIVMEMREDRGSHNTVNPIVVVEIEIHDGQSGATLWKTYHRRQGTDYTKTMHFGTIHTVTGLSRQVADEIINLWLKKGLTQCSVSSRP